MSVAIIVRDEMLTGEIEKETLMHFSMEFVTVRDIIERRVMEEIERFKNTDYPPRANDKETVYDGMKERKSININAEQEIAKAFQLFDENRMIVLINSRQAEALDEKVAVLPNTVISFLKLVPLVGG